MASATASAAPEKDRAPEKDTAQDSSDQTLSSAQGLRSESTWLGRVAGWDNAEADDQIRRGLPTALAAHIQKVLGLTDKEAAALIGRSRSTYARYRNQDKELGPLEAERVVRYARLLALAAETFGALEEATDWMQEPNFALGGDTPFGRAETEPGATLVRDLLLGLQHGHPA